MTMLGWAKLGRAKLGWVTLGPIIVVSVVFLTSPKTAKCPPSPKNIVLHPNVIFLVELGIESIGDWTVLWGLG